MTNPVRWAADAYLQACRLELEAFKPGNVSIHSEGHGMSAEDFMLSARYSAAPLTDFAAGLGRRIHEAVSCTRRAVGCNTNLGVVLLAAPLLEAFVKQGEQTLRQSLQRVLESTSVEDADWCFRAIRLAAPAGLGSSARHDVGAKAEVSLLEAMREAAGRDRVALQYATAYADIFDFTLPLVTGSDASDIRVLIEDAYLEILASIPDTHIARKFGTRVAEDTSRNAAALKERLGKCRSLRQRATLLRAADREYKRAGLNPGTSADLTVATLLTWQLASQRIFPVDRDGGVQSQTFGSAHSHQPQSKEFRYGYR